MNYGTNCKDFGTEFFNCSCFQIPFGDFFFFYARQIDVDSEALWDQRA